MTAITISMLLMTAAQAVAQDGVRYTGKTLSNPNRHDGGLSPVVGVHNIQIMRANREHPSESNGQGWTYNHQPMMAYWNGQFYVHYLCDPKDEQVPPSHTLLQTSADGYKWSTPVMLFPEYSVPDGFTKKGVEGVAHNMKAVMHQRMGFYTAPNGKLLIVGFYGHSYNPFKEGGIGRVVREVKNDGTLGEIYFIRYSSHTSWNESNTSYPFYTHSKDKAFKAACDALLHDRLKTLQWIDEDRGLDGFYTLKDSINTVQATSYFHRKDGKVVVLWKWSYAALSGDEGASWSTPVRCPSLIMAGGKEWGQRTCDGRYAICYNPIETQPYRYPLIAITSDDGIRFDSMCVVHGEVPPRRFMGENKDFGPCYVRGITEGESQPDDSNMWLTYSVNKEDIWVSRVPLPVRTTWSGPVNDDFSDVAPNAAVPNWNIYRSVWCPIWVNEEHQLCLADSDRYDYARAIRVFQTTKNAAVSIRMTVDTESNEPLEIDLTDRHGTRAVCLQLLHGSVTYNGNVVGNYTLGQSFLLNFEYKEGMLSLGGNSYEALHAVNDVERLSIRTGRYRDKPDRNTPNQKAMPPLEGCDDPVAPAIYRIEEVKVR